MNALLRTLRTNQKRNEEIEQDILTREEEQRLLEDKLRTEFEQDMINSII